MSKTCFEVVIERTSEDKERNNFPQKNISHRILSSLSTSDMEIEESRATLPNFEKEIAELLC